MKKRIFCLTAVFIFCLSSLLAQAKPEPMHTAYIVASDANYAQAQELRDYFTEAGNKVAQVKAEDIDSLKDKAYFIVVGAPKDGDAVSALIKDTLNEKQMADAQGMGKAKITITNIGNSEVLFFATDFSIKSFISGSAGQWRELFEEWYDIQLTITQIIGY